MADPAFTIGSIIVSEKVAGFISGAFLFSLGFLLARISANAFVRTLQHRLTAHQLLVWRRMLFYSVLTLFTISALREMGFHLSVLLGAAGVMSVAIGFASQTSASNLISGMFLIGEGPFSIGDFIQVGGTQGEVMSIDLLSVKLRTVDNLYVRIPNEQLIKSEVINLTRFAIRRLSLPIGIAYKENIERVRKVLLEVADHHPLCLDEPKPQVLMQGFGASSVDLSFNVWARREHFVEIKDTLLEAIKKAFDAEHIEIPFNQISINTGSDMTPLPVQFLQTPILQTPDKPAAGQ
jgi:small-conductance mechanosensitive channel